MEFQIMGIKDQGHHFSGGITNKLDTDLAIIQYINSLAFLATPLGFTYIDPDDNVMPNVVYTQFVKSYQTRQNVINKLELIGIKIHDVGEFFSKSKYYKAKLVSDITEALVDNKSDIYINDILEEYLKIDKISESDKQCLRNLQNKEKIWAFFTPNPFRELTAIGQGLFPIFTPIERLEQMHKRMEKSTSFGLFDVPVEDAIEYLKLTGIHFRERMRQLGNFRDMQWLQPGMMDDRARREVAVKFRELSHAVSLDQARKLAAEIETIVENNKITQ